VKIVKQGKLPDRSLTGDCQNCGCRVECLPTEVGVDAVPDRNDVHHCCRCPTEGCGEKIWLSPKKKPVSDHWDDPRR
jgi:hypothetical protein